jgi:hypothetical protein
MKKKRFAEFVESRGDRTPSRRFVVDAEEVPSSFLDLAGSVAVPSEKKGASWKAIKAATWRDRAMARK